MTRVIFVFIASVLLLMPLVFQAGEIIPSDQLILSLPFILLLGIPHGAIDNVLFLKKRSKGNRLFIVGYVILIGVNVLIWLIAPLFAYLIFLLISAYHFGQSQFSHYFNIQNIPQKILYLTWGIALLSGLIYFNREHIREITALYAEFDALAPLHQESLMFSILLSSAAITLILAVFFTISGSLQMEHLFIEILVFGLVMLCFKTMPLLIGFTLYFVILHSLKALQDEYSYLKSKRMISSIKHFARMTLPLTLLSIAGIFLLFGMVYLDILPVSYGYCFLIIISSITFPHVLVMEKFYGKISG